MRITKPQALVLHNSAVTIREKTKEMELLLERLLTEGNNVDSALASLQSFVKENIEEIYASLDKQQSVVSYFLNGFPIKAVKQDPTPESWESALIDELEISDSSIRLLKRHDIFSIPSLITFLQSRSLTELKGCGPTKADKIEEALERYLEKKDREVKGK